MLFAIQCTFAPGALAKAKTLRLEHYEFLRENRQKIQEGGPLLGSGDLPLGMLIVVEAPDADSARSFIQHEPYNAAGLFESVALRRWNHVIPEPSAGYIEGEYQKERALRSGPMESPGSHV